MGTYRNPEIIIDTNGELSSIERNRAKTSMAISSIGQELRKASDRNRARKATNWNIYRQNSEASLAVQEGIVSEGLKKGIDEDTLRNQAKDMMSKFANAKIRLEQSTGYYDGYEADKSYVENTKQTLNTLPDLFSSMSLNVDEYENSMKSKGLGSNAGQINPRFTEPQFAIMTDIANNRPGVSGSVSWKREYTPESGHQWFQVAKGSSIKDANMKMYEETGNKKYLEADDEYVLSYTQIRDNQNNSDGNIYNETTYIKNPSIMAKEGGLGDILSKTVVDDTTGELKEDMYTTDYFERETSIEGMEGKEIAKRVSPNVDKIDQIISPTSDTWANLMTRNGPDTLSAYIETASESREVDGENKFFYKPIMRDSNGRIMKDSEGQVMLGDEKQVGGDEGYFETEYNAENSKRNGYSNEDYKEIQELIQYDLLKRTGALSSGVIQRDEQRSQSYKSQLKPKTPTTPSEGEREGSYKKRLIDENLNAAIEALDKDPSQVTLAGLNNLKTGYAFEIPNKSRPNEITVYSKETAASKDRSIIMEIDLGTEEGRDEARQNLYSEFGVRSIVDQEKPTFEEGAKERFEKNKPLLEITDELRYSLEEKVEDTKDFKVKDDEDEVTDMLNKRMLRDGRTLSSALKDKGIEVKEDTYYAGTGLQYLNIMKDGEKVGKEINITETGKWRKEFLDAIEKELLTDTEKEIVVEGYK